MIDQETSTVDLQGPAIDSTHELHRGGRFKQRMNLKSQLKLYMNHKSITAVQLAKATGVSKQVISLWLAGSSPRKLDQVKKVADHFGISIDDLCYGSGVLSKDRVNLNSVPEDEWIGGVFEVKFRRIKESK